MTNIINIYILYARIIKNVFIFLIIMIMLIIIIMINNILHLTSLSVGSTKSWRKRSRSIYNYWHVLSNVFNRRRHYDYGGKPLTF